VSILLLLKLTVTPLLVAGMSLVARRFGPTVGGLLMGLPWMTGPVLFFLAIERGDVYLAETARGALLAIPPMAVFGMVYAAAANRFSWPFALAGAAGAFALSGWLISGLGVPASGVAVAGITSLLSARWFIAALLSPPGPLSMPWWDIPARMLATATLVGFITLSSDILGPTLSGIVSSYPVILTVVGVFTHARWGAAAVTALIRGLMLSLIGFVVFFWIVATFAPEWGRIPAYVAAVAAATSFNASLLAFNRWRQRQPVAAGVSPAR
jgi:hypothetical protein